MTHFSTLCKWLFTDYCILGLPAEINQASTATYLLQWLKSIASWQPNCVAIGNEPYGWTQYDKYWTGWPVTPPRPKHISGGNLSDEVLNYTDAIRNVNTGQCIFGLEANTNYKYGAYELANISANVTNLTGESFHLYPDLGCNGQSISQLLAVHNLSLIQTAYTHDFVPNAGGKPVAIHEFNLGLSTCGPYIQSNVGAVFTSATVAQALALGIPNLSYFRFDCGGVDCMVDNKTGNETYTYKLYSGLFTHMNISTIWNATISPGLTPETFAVIGGVGNDYDSLLVSNAAPTTWENISLSRLIAPGCSPTPVVYYQTPGKGVWTYSLPSNFSIELPRQSTAVVDFWCSSSPTGDGPSHEEITDPTVSASERNLAQSPYPTQLQAPGATAYRSSWQGRLATAVRYLGRGSDDLP